MADPRYLEITYNGAGATIYAIIRRKSDGYVWNGSAFAAWADGSIATYDIPLTDRGGDFYSVAVPDDVTAGSYKVTYYLQSGGTPAVGDAMLDSDDVTYLDAAAAATTDTSAALAGLTKLRAVNEILGGIGEAAVASLDTGGSSEAATAERILDEVVEELLGEGWGFNTADKTLALDDEGRIPLATTILEVQPKDTSITDICVRRGNYLYNVTDDTDIFTDEVEATCVVNLAFEDLPPAAKVYFTKEAKWRFQREVQGSTTQDRLLLEEVARARARLLRLDGRARRLNIFDGEEASGILGNRNDYMVSW